MHTTVFFAPLRLCVSFFAVAAFAAYGADEAAISAAIDRLNHEDFDTREKGAAELRAAICAGDETAVRTALEQRLKTAPTAELKQQAERILALCQGGPIVNGLRARLIVEQNDKGEADLRAPFTELPKVTVRVTNVGNETVQVLHSSYPCYRFFKLKIARLDEAGKAGDELAAHWDIYPTKDMEAPQLAYATLKPGEHLDRDMTLQLREGYLMQTFSRSFAAAFKENQAKGFGKLRAPGLYQMSGEYATGAEKTEVFEGARGRNANLPLWAGKLATPAIKLRVADR